MKIGACTAAAVLAVASSSPAQCEFQWLTGPAQGLPGVSGEIADQLAWDPDGDGPQAEILIIAGSFQIVGDIHPSGLAAWDGVSWMELGGGLDYNGQPGSAGALAIFQGDLIVGGQFTSAGDVPTNSIARWDGAAWHPLNDGLTSDHPPYVSALLAEGDSLYVGGAFNMAGGVTVSNLARWDGHAWYDIGGGVVGEYDVVQTLAEFEGDLIVGGRIDTAGGVPVHDVARWNGAEWQPMGTTVDDVHALAVYQGSLLVGFTQYFGSALLAWDGADWSAFAGGVEWRSGWYSSQVWDMTVSGGSLFVGGLFDTAGDASVRHIAVWNGSKWSDVGGKIGPPLNEPPVYGLTEFRGGIVAAGRLEQVAQLNTPSIAWWDGDIWHALGTGFGHFVSAVQTWGDDLYLGGRFKSFGDEPIVRIARWDGQAMHTLGAGIGTKDGDEVLAMTVFQGLLIAGGEFNIAGGQTARHIAQWDGQNWSQPGKGFDGNVTGLAADADRLFACGQFTKAGALDTPDVAVWDGAAWSRLGTGLQGTPNSANAVALYHGDLFLGGMFAAVDGQPAIGIARWDGQVWHSVGSGLGDPHHEIRALTVYNDALVAAGLFGSAGGVNVHNIAAWDGAAWHALGGGVGGQVNALAVHDGDLFAAGVFQKAGGQTVNYIARWDGAAWHGLDSGLSDRALALGEYRSDLIVGGRFRFAGDTVSAYWARWGCPEDACYPDFNGDGTLDLFDFLAFVNAFNAEDAAADCDAGGGLDLFDFLCFVNSFNAGC